VLIRSQPYRNRKLGEKALQVVADAVAANKTKKISYIYLHVQSNNTDAKRFYENHGFKPIELVEGYYKRLEPRDAWILKREFQ
jgi:ribosomal protein S18 acetylase RimI-like enzyme